MQRLQELGASHIKIFGGGGGVIVQKEIDLLHSRGVERIYSPEDGRRLGLVGMISDLLERSDTNNLVDPPESIEELSDDLRLARAISFAENDRAQISP